MKFLAKLFLLGDAMIMLPMIAYQLVNSLVKPGNEKHKRLLLTGFSKTNIPVFKPYFQTEMNTGRPNLSLITMQLLSAH